MAEDDPGWEPTPPNIPPMRADGAEELVTLTVAKSGMEAAEILGALRTAGIRQVLAPVPRRGPAGGRIRVRAQDLERAREVLSAPPMSESELIQAEEQASDAIQERVTQSTEPQGKNENGGEA
jgi:hypothetical protein